MEDASLDDFLDSDDGETGEDDEESDADGEAVDPSTVEPATTTYGWSPESVACETCGAAVDRRWRDDGAFVCPDCKEW